MTQQATPMDDMAKEETAKEETAKDETAKDETAKDETAKPARRPPFSARREGWGARWAGMRRQAAAQWRALSARERRLVGAGTLALFAAALWLLGIEPALRQITRWQAEIPRLQSQAQAIEDVLRDVPQAASSPAGPGAQAQGGEQPAAAVRASLAAANLQAHVQAQALEEAGQAPVLQLIFQAAPVDRAMAWLMTGPAQAGLSVTEAELVRDDRAQAEQPTVSGQLRLAPTQTLEEGS